MAMTYAAICVDRADEAVVEDLARFRRDRDIGEPNGLAIGPEERDHSGDGRG